jgi:hypothetical protein
MGSTETVVTLVHLQRWDALTSTETATELDAKNREVFERLRGLNPYSIVEQAVKVNPELASIREKLYVPASYIDDVLHFRLRKDSDYHPSRYIFEKNLRRILEAHGTSMEDFIDIRRRLLLDSKELVELVPDVDGLFKAEGGGPWNTHFGWFSPSQVKLHYLKALVNSVAHLIPNLLMGDRVEEAEQTVSRLVNRVSQRLREPLGYEQREGLLPKSRDSNMERVLNAVQRGLVYICEEDNYYRAWIGHLCLCIWEEISRLYEEFDLEMFNRDLVAKRVKMNKGGVELSFEEMFRDPQAKLQLFKWFMSKHLGYLPTHDSEMRDTSEK